VYRSVELVAFFSFLILFSLLFFFLRRRRRLAFPIVKVGCCLCKPLFSKRDGFRGCCGREGGVEEEGNIREVL